MFNFYLPQLWHRESLILLVYSTLHRAFQKREMTRPVNAIYCHLTKALHSSPYLLKRKIATFVPNHMDSLAAARSFGVGDQMLNQANRLRKNYSAAFSFRGARLSGRH